MSGRSRPRPLWTCPACGRRFANRNQSHTCAAPTTLEHHLADKPEHVRAIVERLVAVTGENGPFDVVAEKTRLAFFVRMTFAALRVRRQWVDAHVILARRLEHPRFTKLITYGPRNHEHDFRVRAVDEIDDDVAAWLAEAYAVGEQRHLTGGLGGRETESREPGGGRQEQ